MNKLYVFAVVAASLSLSACSNDEDLVGENASSQEMPEFIPGDSEQEIRLGSGMSSPSIDADPMPWSRAAIEGDSNLQGMGVFCLAKGKQQLNQLPPDITWFDDSVNWSSCIMDNVKSNKSGANITWANGETYYYPISQFYTYDFYGYYPYVEKGSLVYSTNSVKANFVLDGKTDLIWGRATSNAEGAYSASYFRKSGNASNLPQLDLQHMLTRLKFFVTPAPDVEGSSDVTDASNMEVVSLSIIDSKKNVSLMIADHNNLSMPLKNRLTATNNTNEELKLCDTDGNEISEENAVSVGDDVNTATQVGESLLLFPQSQYTVRIVLRNKNTNHVFPTETPLLVYGGSSFEMGKSYKVDIKVHGPKSIQLTAKLHGWDEVVDGPSIEL